MNKITCYLSGLSYLVLGPFSIDMKAKQKRMYIHLQVNADVYGQHSDEDTDKQPKIFKTNILMKILTHGTRSLKLTFG